MDVRRMCRVEYEDGLALQEALVAAVAAGNAPDTLVLLEHDPVITLGRGAKGTANVLLSASDLEARGITLHETGRGGDVTWHGPGQLVGYPIVNLARERSTKDVRKFVRSIEEVLLRTCADFGITAARDEINAGAWVGGNKIGAIGVRVSKWVTSHGFALNVNPDLSAFDLIVPCGIPGRGVTSIEREIGRAVALEEVEYRVMTHAAEVFGQETKERPPEHTTVAIAIRRAGEIPPQGGPGSERTDPQLLVLRRVPARGGFWQIVTGRMEPGETPWKAAVRELREETGFAEGERGVTMRLLGYDHMFGASLDRLAPGAAPSIGREIAFVATIPPELDVALSDEHDAHEWLAPADAAARVRFAGHRRAVRLAAAARLR